MTRTFLLVFPREHRRDRGECGGGQRGARPIAGGDDGGEEEAEGQDDIADDEPSLVGLELARDQVRRDSSNERDAHLEAIHREGVDNRREAREQQEREAELRAQRVAGKQKPGRGARQGEDHGRVGGEPAVVGAGASGNRRGDVHRGAYDGEPEQGAPALLPNREKTEGDHHPSVRQEHDDGSGLARGDERCEQRAGESDREQRALLGCERERGQRGRGGCSDRERGDGAEHLQVRTGSPRIDVDDRERKREEHVAESHVAVVANPEAHTGDDPGADESEDDANGRPEMSVLDCPREKSPDAHEDRERRDGDGAIATEEFLEVDVGIQVAPRDRNRTRRRWVWRRGKGTGQGRGTEHRRSGSRHLRLRSGLKVRRRRTRSTICRPQLRAQGRQLFVQRTHVLLKYRNSLFVRHRSPVGEAARTSAAARSCAPRM